MRSGSVTKYVATMTKRTLGSVVKEARDEYRMTQRDLAAAVGVKASHVEYIENARRRPSIALINRLSATLGLDAKEVLVLAHPEAKQIIEARSPQPKPRQTFARMIEYSGRLWEERVANPGSDLISMLIHADSEGETMSKERYLGTFILLVAAGNETTRNSISGPYASRSASIGLFGYVGGVSYYLAILATVLERFGEAEGHFCGALEFETRMIARAWAARVRYRYAAMLVSRGDARAYAKALEMVSDALSVAEALQLPDLVTRSRELKSLLASLESDSHTLSGRIASAGGERSLAFRKEGDYWTIGSGPRTFRLRDSKGLGYIAQLLRQPGAEFNSLNLMAAFIALSDEGDDSVAAVRKMGVERLANINLRRGLPDHAGEMLDSKAKAAYKRRLVELNEELEEVREIANSECAAELEDEIEALHQELRRAIGLGGRDRLAGSTSERARLAVTRAIKIAIQKITEHDSELGALFSQSIRTGTFCSFVVSDRNSQISWQL